MASFGIGFDMFISTLDVGETLLGAMLAIWFSSRVSNNLLC